ncbi:MAG TPA: copper transporter [Acidimicrobiales bacterium]|nr:copper transporter [Acidimicrobiales bacterium]
MINLRYHIVSLTAVFLAIGIGLTLGSTFLDRATVDNLNGQLESLEGRLGERDAQIDELQQQVERTQALQESLDEQGPGLLAGRLDPVPVLLVASQGVDEADVDGVVQSLEVAGAEVQGLWWLSERFLLGNDADIDDLAAALEETSTDPARLRRVAVAALGDELRDRQTEEPVVPEPTEGQGEEPGEAAEPGTGDAPDPGTTGGAGQAVDPGTGQPVGPPDPAEEPSADEATDLGDVQALLDAGFVVFEPIGSGPDEPTVPAGVRLVVIGGSPAVPDDVVVQPLLARLTDDVEQPTATVVASALGGGDEVSEVVASVRDDERLRSVVSTVDDLDHFQGWMAIVLAVEDVGEAVIGHYGLGEGASSLLPPLQEP